jgi:hypothetical protein
MGRLDNYTDADIAFHTSEVIKADNKTLLRYLSGLSNTNNTNTGTQHRDIIRGLTINNILLQRHVTDLQGHITTLDAKNSITTYAVVALTVASLIGTGIQTWYGYKADRRSEAEASATAEKLQTPTPSVAKPYSPSIQSSGPSIPGSGVPKK